MKKIYAIALAALAFAACSDDKDESVKISIVPATATVYTDEALPSLSLNVTPQDALDGKTVEWTSSRPEVISVDANGGLTFQIIDCADTELPVTITATVGEKSVSAVITVKGQIARYQILDFSSSLGLLMLDRNVGATEAYDATLTDEAAKAANIKAAVGNYYQWGQNKPVAKGGETAVNSNYSATWSWTELFYDNKGKNWSEAANSPCPGGWDLPNAEQMSAIDKGLEAIGLYDYGMASDEEYDAAVALFNSMKVAPCGQFNKNNLDKIYLPDACYFWSSYTSEDKSQLSDFEYNLFPLYSKSKTYDLAIPVRCVKAATVAE